MGLRQKARKAVEEEDLISAALGSDRPHQRGNPVDATNLAIGARQ